MSVETRLPLELIFDFDNQMDAFGALESRPDGERKIHINMAAILWVCAKEKDAQWKEITAETVLHEVLHAIQQTLGRLFTEAEVDEAINRASGMTPAEYQELPDTKAVRRAYEDTVARAEHAEAQVERLREGLAKYAAHPCDECGFEFKDGKPIAVVDDCTCGLDALLDEFSIEDEQ